MKKQNFYNYAPVRMSSVYRGEGDGDGENTTFTKEQVDAAIAAAVAKANDEASSKFNETKTSLLSDLKKAKEQAKAFEGLDPDKIRNMMSTFENDQDLKDISEGKVSEVIERKLEKERAQFKSKLEATIEEMNKYKGQSGELVNKVSKLMIDNNVVSQFVKEKGLESGIEDVILRANQIFKVEGDDLIPRDANGQIITGKNGPMTISEWVVSLKEKAPHLFPGSRGSGANGGDAGEQSGIEAKIQAAAASGNMDEYRRLRNEQKKKK